MSISDNKVRCSLVIEKNDKLILESMAKKDDRSVNYIINQAIKEFIKKNLPNKEEWLKHNKTPPTKRGVAAKHIIKPILPLQPTTIVSLLLLS